MRFRKVHELAPEEAIASNEGWSAHRLETQAVEEASNADLEWADAIILGTPTRYGLPTAQLKQFLDAAGKLWVKGALVNKICSSFTSTGTAHGGCETTSWHKCILNLASRDEAAKAVVFLASRVGSNISASGDGGYRIYKHRSRYRCDGKHRSGAVQIHTGQNIIGC